MLQPNRYKITKRSTSISNIIKEAQLESQELDPAVALGYTAAPRRGHSRMDGVSNTSRNELGSANDLKNSNAFNKTAQPKVFDLSGLSSPQLANS